MNTGSHEHHHHDGEEETSAFIHRSHLLVIPLCAAGSVLSVLHEQGLPFKIGAVFFWLLVLFVSGAAGDHDWRACSHCDGPPRAEATAEARTKMARRVHRRNWFTSLLTAGVLVHVFLPKSYMGPWWTYVIVGIAYFVLSVRVTMRVIRFTQHKANTSDCHLDWCRTGRHQKPGLNRRQRAVMWVEHYGVWIIFAVAPTAAALGILTETSGDYNSVRALYGMATIGLFMIVMAVLVGHGDSVCLHCVGSLPDNPEQTAEERVRWLRLFHRSHYILLTGAALAWVVSWVLAGSIPAKVLVCAAAFIVVTWAMLERVHSPLKPWCPWCKDDGGEDAHAETPDPSRNVPSPA